MSMTMVMEEDEEDVEIEHVFIAHEIDLDYEFDAARFFDFTRPETPSEAHEAQLWFQNAAGYPPSPFVRRLLVAREDLFLEDVSDSPKSEHVECASNVVDDEKSSVPLGIGFSDTAFENCGMAQQVYFVECRLLVLLSFLRLHATHVLTESPKTLGENISGLLAGIQQNDGTRSLQVPTGLTFGSKTISNNLNSKAKSAVPKSSTLMKPTASQLAKQNRPSKNIGSRFQKLLTRNEHNLSISSGVESQAAKRQKLEGGLLCKVSDVKQQTNFFHKAPMMAVAVEQNSACSKLKLTNPREPDLRTARRGQRIRPKNVREAEHVTVPAPRFKARPLNRKILEAPSLLPHKRSTPRLPEFQEFHLKTLERAMQHTSAMSSSLHYDDSDKGWDKHTTVSALENRIKDLRRPAAAAAAPTDDGLGFTHIFKAQSLNKKILPSKGNGGVFHNSKHETTVPMESDLQTEKEVQHDPPIELFSKLTHDAGEGFYVKGKPNFSREWQLHQFDGCKEELGNSVTKKRGKMCNLLSYGHQT
ncbi:hypothetical protein JHK86_011880 [Glycine max]|nr:hypothetical protein JHK86_011880 [Glycine max]